VVLLGRDVLRSHERDGVGHDEGMAERNAANKGTKKSAKSTTGKPLKGFTDEERGAAVPDAVRSKASVRARGGRARCAGGRPRSAPRRRSAIPRVVSSGSGCRWRASERSRRARPTPNGRIANSRSMAPPSLAVGLSCMPS